MGTSFANSSARRSFEPFSTLGQHARIQQGPNGLLIHVMTPAIGQHEAPTLSSEILTALEDTPSRCRWLAIDLSDVSVVSSMGLAVCLNVRKRAGEQGMKTALYGMNAHLRGLFQVMKVERLYKVLHSKDDLQRLIEG
jgi:anti-anti-sigma factor